MNLEKQKGVPSVLPSPKHKPAERSNVTTSLSILRLSGRKHYVVKIKEERLEYSLIKDFILKAVSRSKCCEGSRCQIAHIFVRV